MTTLSEAYTDVMSRVKAKWDTTGFPIVYPDVPLDAAAQAAIDSGSTAWARVTFKPNQRSQTSLATAGNAKYTAEGIVIVETYAPSGDGGTLSRTLTDLVETAYEGVSVSNGVWYRNVRTDLVGPDGHWTHSNVIAEWSYDQVR
jgi:hypothetical protein